MKAKELEDYIMNELLLLLMNDRYEEPFWSIFEFELRQLNKTTRRYKLYQDYMEKFQFATKTAI